MKYRLIFKTLFSSFIGLSFPKRCRFCSMIIAENEEACEFCKQGLVEIDSKKRCLKCGLEKDYCTCGFNIYYFDAIVSVYDYDSVAKNEYFKYKFGGRKRYAYGIAEKMSNAVKKEFAGIDFDCACPLPSGLASKMKRGFGHSELLCKAVARNLGIPYNGRLLRCKLFAKPQHFSSYKERFENVRKKYYTDNVIKGGKVLLVDDIKTTGASLSACARCLLKASADSVYCVTYLEKVFLKNKKTDGE